MATYRHCDLKSHWRPRQLIYMHTPIENVKLTSSSGKLLFYALYWEDRAAAPLLSLGQYLDFPS